jgi:hypothetical protein
MRVALMATLVAIFATLATGVHAATSTGTQTVTATVSAAASLTLGASTVTFASQPGSTASITQTESGAQLNVTANARTSSAGAVTLTVVAGGDLASGGQTIPVGNLTWTGTGTGFNATGTMNKTTAQSVGSWTGSGVYSGTMTYAFANSWTYATGSYTATLTYTLTAP